MTTGTNSIEAVVNQDIETASTSHASSAEQAEKEKGFNFDFGKIIDSIFDFIGNFFSELFKKWAGKYTVAARAADDVKSAVQSTFGEAKSVMVELLNSVTTSLQVVAEEILDSFTEQFSQSNTGRVLKTLAGLSNIGSSLLGFFSGGEFSAPSLAKAEQTPEVPTASTSNCPPLLERVNSRLSNVAKLNASRSAQPTEGVAATL